MRDGRVVADPARDLAKLAVVERHHATGRVGVGLVRGFGLRSGAFASTVAHDAHNIVVVGVDDASMAACVERLAELGGGIAVADGGAVRGELALPVAGLLSEAPAEEVVERLDALVALLRDQGVRGDAPFMTLSFLALSVIPDLKLTDRGLVDVVARASSRSRCSSHLPLMFRCHPRAAGCRRRSKRPSRRPATAVPSSMASSKFCPT